MATRNPQRRIFMFRTGVTTHVFALGVSILFTRKIGWTVGIGGIGNIAWNRTTGVTLTIRIPGGTRESGKWCKIHKTGITTRIMRKW